ncbi:MAG: Mur ligase family protein [Ilumatobacteraceae bacterium]
MIHITGTNGKGSVAQMITRLLMAQGLKVGTYTSPHLERINERSTVDGEAITDDEFAEAVSAVADLEVLVGVRPSFFEITTAVAFRHFSDVAVDVAVIEVGLLGRWDATNVVEPMVAVVTNVGLDHRTGRTDQSGRRPREGRHREARERPGPRGDRSGAGGDLQSGRSGGDLRAATTSTASATISPWAAGCSICAPRPRSTPRCSCRFTDAIRATTRRWRCVRWKRSSGRRSPRTSSPRVRQRRVAGTVRGPRPPAARDRRRCPQPAGADQCSAVFFQDFDPVGRRILVTGCLHGKDRRRCSQRCGPRSSTSSTAPRHRRRGGCPPPTSRQRRELGCDDILTVDDLFQAVAAAYRECEADDALLVTGSLYVVGAARPYLQRLVT